jgi:hypothetical protein
MARFELTDLRTIKEFPIVDSRPVVPSGLLEDPAGPIEAPGIEIGEFIWRAERLGIIRIILARDCREERHHAGSGNDRPGWIGAVKALREEGKR